MEKHVLEAIERFHLLDGVNSVTVALSGGADSMALLNVLLSLREDLGVSVNAAHLNHLIRGEEAFRDEEFVKKYCEAVGVELFCKRVDIPEYAKINGISTELAARQVRYEFLEEVNSGVVATAHTASDNLETVIFNLARGTAIDGLCGIPPKRNIFIRPLILCARSQIEDYCDKNAVSYVTDSTNLSDDYTRNKIRNNVIPVLKEINPSVENAVIRTVNSLREDADIISEISDEFFLKNKTNDFLLLDNFEKLSLSIAKRVIKKYITFVDDEISISNFHIEQVYGICINGGKCSLPNDYCAIAKENKLSVVKNSKNEESIEFAVEISEKNAEFLKISQKINNLLLKNSLDCDNIVGELVIRTRNKGDKIRLKNRGCTKTLNQLYNENKIPLEIRDKLPVIADDLGVVWICGIGVAHRCAVGEKTKHVYEIEVKKSEERQ